MGCGPSAPPPAAEAPPPAVPVRIELPAAVSFPEGIAYDAAAGVFYTGRAEDGTLVRVNATTGASDVVKPGGTLMPSGGTTFPGVLGMDVDDSHRLWVSGGFTGKMWVVDPTSGSVLKAATVPTAGTSLINVVVVVGGAGCFTDTFIPTLWRLPVNGDTFGELEPWLDLSGTAIE